MGVYYISIGNTDTTCNNKLARNLGILSKLRYYIDLNILKQIYYALIYPYLSYGILAWGCASKTRLDCLRIKHNKCLRTIFFVHPRESAAPYFKLLTILKVDNIYKLKICCFIHRMRMKLITFQIFSLMSWLQHRTYTIIIQDLLVMWILLGQE